MTPLVSILIPAHNAERWVGAAAESALAQTWSRKEVIVVDDGSTDGTLAAARRFESPSVKIVSQSNQGASAARNAALSQAQGSYIQWLDADDVLAPDKIERQIEHILRGASEDILFSSAWARFYYRMSKAKPAQNLLWATLDPVDWLIGKIGGNGWMAIETWLVSRQLAEAAGPWNTELTLDDDGEYVSRLVRACQKVVFEPSAVSFIRQANLTSLTRGRSEAAKRRSQFAAMKLQIRNLLALEDSARTRDASLAYLQRWLGFFYPDTGLVREAQKLAAELGGELAPPAVRPKYVVVEKLGGWELANHLSTTIPELRARFVNLWDKCLFELCGR